MSALPGGEPDGAAPGAPAAAPLTEPAPPRRAVMTGGEAAARTLLGLGVRTVFGIPSVHNLPTVDALGVLGEPAFVVARHEQGAGAMADAYARASGGLAVMLTSTGPGACNSVSPMYEAELSCSPVLQITGQVPTELLDRGKGTLHEIRDQPGLLGAVTKGVLRARTLGEIPAVVRAGADLALSGRPGPAVVEIPIDLQYAEGEVEIDAGGLTPARAAPDPADVAAAARLCQQARRVVIWAGGGAVRSGASRELAALAERLGAAVVTSTNGRGAVDESHPLCIGALIGDDEVRAYLESADVWLALGTRLRDEGGRPTTPPADPRSLVHVNVDATQRDRNRHAQVFMPADVRLTVNALLQALGPGRREPDPAVAGLAARARERALQRLGPWRHAVDALEAAMPPDSVLVRDATMAAYTFGNRLVRVHRPGASIYPASVAIGFGLPFALGAQLADPARPVVALLGDGGFMLNVGELATAVQNRVPAVLMLFNDRGYDVLRRTQDSRFGRRVGVDLHTPDFAKLCEAFGLRHIRVGTLPELGPALQRALAGRDQGPVMLEVDVDGIGALPG